MKKENGISKNGEEAESEKRVQQGRRLAQTLNIDAAPLLLVVDLA